MTSDISLECTAADVINYGVDEYTKLHTKIHINSNFIEII